MNRLLTTTGKRIGYLSYDLSDGETGATVVLRVIPADGYVLRASPADDDVVIQARENGSGDPWTDIEATPIDLSGYTPDVPVDFDFRTVAGSPLVDIRRLALYLAVTKSAPALWNA
jgi:hypothetical protein